MILPTKHLREERSLLGVGAQILDTLDTPKTISQIWEQFRDRRSKSHESFIPFDWFILALDLLFSVGAITLKRGLLNKAGSR